MNIDWTTRGISVGKHLRDKIEHHLQRLERFLQGDEQARVVVTQAGDCPLQRHTVEIIVRHRLGTFTAKQESPDLAGAVRDVLRRLENQAHKAHDKLVEHRRHDSATFSEPIEAP